MIHPIQAPYKIGVLYKTFNGASVTIHGIDYYGIMKCSDGVKRWQDPIAKRGHALNDYQPRQLLPIYKQDEISLSDLTPGHIRDGTLVTFKDTSAVIGLLTYSKIAGAQNPFIPVAKFDNTILVDTRKSILNIIDILATSIRLPSTNKAGLKLTFRGSVGTDTLPKIFTVSQRLPKATKQALREKLIDVLDSELGFLNTIEV